MNERGWAKKEAEQLDLEFFLTEHARLTGTITHVVRRGERPDFEVRRGERNFGLEIVQVVEAPDERFFRVLFHGRDEMTVSEASNAIQEAVYLKEQKRVSTGWKHPDSTILVVHLKGRFSKDVIDYWDETILEELSRTGFFEIWLCDHSPPFHHGGAVKLVRVKPAE